MSTSPEILAALLLSGLMGLLGQGIRAAVGLKSAATLTQGMPSQQSEFNAAYFLLSMMIGFIAGVLAGIGVGIDQLMKIDPTNIKLLLGIAVAGYAGADFIENAFTRIIPGLGAPTTADSGSVGGAAANAAALRTLTTHVNALASTVSTLATTLPKAPDHGAPADAAPTSTVPALTAALRIVAPKVNTDVWAPALIAAFTKFDMVSNKRMAAAVGQFLVEAGAGFQELVENLNYTHADRIAAVFPREFPTAADAELYVGKPEALANIVYANKLGNGDQASGDGFRFCGRGLIQLTGRDEYTDFAATVGMTPELASAYCETPAGAAMSGCWFLSSRGCLLLADIWALSKITAKVNGAAMEGNTQRIAYSEAMLKALGG